MHGNLLANLRESLQLTSKISLFCAVVFAIASFFTVTMAIGFGVLFMLLADAFGLLDVMCEIAVEYIEAHNGKR